MYFNDYHFHDDCNCKNCKYFAFRESIFAILDDFYYVPVCVCLIASFDDFVNVVYFGKSCPHFSPKGIKM